MSIFHPLCNAPTDEYIKDLEDEVMTPRAKLQVQDTAIRDLRDTVHAAEMDRDFWKEEAAMWKKRADELAIDKVFGRVI